MNHLLAGLRASIVILALLGSGGVRADLISDIQQLQKRWAEINYRLDGQEQRLAFESLIQDAASVRDQYPTDASAWIWSGIIKSTYAGVTGGLGALKLAKASKAELETALKLDPKSMGGSAYTSLGALYFNVPGWPIGFGNDKKAEKYLLKGIAINPDGIDSNYFYGDFLNKEKRYQEAQTYFLKAQSAPKRPGRPLADTGRQREISEALRELKIIVN